MIKRTTSTVAIIGGGPAGISCALQLKRFGIDCALFEKEQLGGMLHNANLIENYPGFPGGIQGIELVELLKKQVKDFKLNAQKTEITSVEYKCDQFELSGDQFQHICSRLVLATGTKAAEIENITIQEGARKRIFREVYPLRNSLGKTIGIAGAGDAAFDYALSLADRNVVYIFNRSRKIKAIGCLVHRAMEHSNIRYMEDVYIREVALEENSLKIFSNRDGYQMDLLIFAIGRSPALDLLSGKLQKNQKELVRQQKLFFIGDVSNKGYRQMAIAAGDGIKCAMLINELENESDKEG